MQLWSVCPMKEVTIFAKTFAMIRQIKKYRFFVANKIYCIFDEIISI